jgi:hypothetical protein
MEMYNDLKASWNVICQESEMPDAWRRVDALKEEDAKEKAQQEAETKRENMARLNRYIGVLDKFIREGDKVLSSFAKTDRVNFNDKESALIYYGIMASAVKPSSMNLFILGGLTRGFEPLFLRTEMFPLQSVFLEKVNQVPTFGCTNMFPLHLRMHLRDCS